MQTIDQASTSRPRPTQKRPRITYYRMVSGAATVDDARELAIAYVVGVNEKFRIFDVSIKLEEVADQRYWATVEFRREKI